ncbi:MAG: cyclase family protein, partial [bacterium]|nr:cyclase family protein [bacterium]
MAENNWGRWGDEDERGALNLLTPDVVKQASASITTGKVYPLGIPIQSQGVPIMDYRGTPMRLTLQNASDEGIYEAYGCHAGTGAHEDVLVFASHTTSHMDALCHVYGQDQHYNGFSKEAMKTHTGASRLGIEKVGVIAGRAVLLDMVAHTGADGWLEAGTPISGADMAACAEAQGTPVRAGDIVLIRTGYLDMWWSIEADPTAEQPFAQPGINNDGA